MLEWFRSRGVLGNFKAKQAEIASFLTRFAPKGLLSTPEGFYFGAVTVTNAGRNTRSAMR